MNHADLIQHFGSNAEAARALRVKPQVVHQWKERGQIPAGWQQAIEEMTDGALRRDADTVHPPVQDRAA